MKISALVVVCFCLVAAPASAGEPQASAASDGCGLQPPLAPGSSIGATMQVGELEREYRLHLPTGYDPSDPAPLVLVFHGYTGTAERVEMEYTSFSSHSDEQGYVVLYPQATGFDAGGSWVTSWNDLACNASPGTAGPICTDNAVDYPTPPECGEPRGCDWCSCYDDVRFIEALLDQVEESLCIDRDRVFATGISNGGMFVHRLGCALPHRFAAIAPVAGTLAKGFNCAPSSKQAVSMMNIHATRDRTVPYDGTPSSDGFLYTPTSEVLDLWATDSSQSCSAEATPYPTSKDGVNGFRCSQRAECASGAQLVDCSWDGGHDWPRHGEGEFASTVIWEFFAGVTGAQATGRETAEREATGREVAGREAAGLQAFESASTVEEVRRRIEEQPKDTSWWNVNGEAMSWNNRNLNRLFPTVNVYRAGPVRELERQPMPEIADFEVDTPSGPMRFADFLGSDLSTSMGMVILHEGKIVFEDYPRMQPYERPIYWSVTKVLVSAVLSILEDRGRVDIDEPIDTYIPELSGSAYSGITVRNILDMASGVDCSEEYYDKSSCYYRLMETTGEAIWDETSADNPYTYIAGLQVGKFAAQGTSFEYGSINTYILGWLVEKLTGMPFQDALSREIWTQIGAEGDAAMLAPRFGVPLFAGGFLGRLRDLARFGLLFTPSYRVVSDRKIISDRHIDMLKNGGRPELLANARWGPPEGFVQGIVKHNVYQWDLVYTNNDIYKGGWAGQGLLVNPDRDLVAVYVGYFNEDQSELSVLPRLRQVLNGVFGPEDPPNQPEAER
jgi:poly(3-hydroxybutyrate) depolymerase/CubicO group peptidase (beta-lactamase class C family)